MRRLRGKISQHFLHQHLKIPIDIQATKVLLGVDRDNGKENGNYRGYIGMI